MSVGVSVRAYCIHVGSSCSEVASRVETAMYVRSCRRCVNVDIINLLSPHL